MAGRAARSQAPDPTEPRVRPAPATQRPTHVCKRSTNPPRSRENRSRCRRTLKSCICTSHEVTQPSNTSLCFQARGPLSTHTHARAHAHTHAHRGSCETSVLKATASPFCSGPAGASHPEASAPRAPALVCGRVPVSLASLTRVKRSAAVSSSVPLRGKCHKRFADAAWSHTGRS